VRTVLNPGGPGQPTGPGPLKFFFFRMAEIEYKQKSN
jgi:hypothetical protein